MSNTQNNIDHNYSKEASTIIAGIAVILMIIHHLFGFDYFLRPDVSWQGIPIPILENENITVEYYFAHFCKICVSLFAFNTGYAMFVKSQDYLGYKAVFNRIIRVLLPYWYCYIIFIIYGYLFGEELPGAKYIALNMFGINCSQAHNFVNISFGWYVSFYIICMLISPLLVRLFSRYNFLGDVILLISIRIILSLVQILDIPCLYGLNQDLWPLITVCSGFLIAKYRIIQFINKEILSKLHIVGLVMLLGLIIAVEGGLRVYNYAGSVSDTITAILFICVIMQIYSRYNSSRIFTILTSVGSCSMLIWYFHCLMFTGSRPLQLFMYYSHEPIVITFVSLVVFFIIARIAKTIYDRINLVTCNMFRKLALR